MALQILGRKFYKNTKKNILILPKPFDFAGTTVVERHPITREIRYLPRTNGKHGLFLHEQPVHLHTEKTQTKLQT